VVVSEETGNISLVAEGQIRRGLDGQGLKHALLEALEVEEAIEEKEPAVAAPAGVEGPGGADGASAPKSPAR
jgi:hypothetical protein